MIQPRFLSIMLIFTAWLTVFSVHAVETKTVVLDVPGMTCKFCPITIRKALNKVTGVNEVKADFETKTATVTFDPDKTSIAALTRATANAGYPSSLRQ